MNRLHVELMFMMMFLIHETQVCHNALCNIRALEMGPGPQPNHIRTNNERDVFTGSLNGTCLHLFCPHLLHSEHAQIKKHNNNYSCLKTLIVSLLCSCC